MPRQRLFEREPPTAESSEEEEGFEEVRLNDDNKQQTQQAPISQPKKRSFFSKFSDHIPETGNITAITSASPTTTRFSLLPSRKRAQSGQGAELGSVEPKTSGLDSGKEMMDVSLQA